MYKEIKPPCYGCTKRHTGCHGKCSEYSDWNNQRQKMLEERKKSQDIERKLDDSEIRRNIQIKHARKNRRRFGK